MTTQHTPTPWKCAARPGPCGTHLLCIASANDLLIADIWGGSEANAAFIVRAVNAHDELVAALRGVLVWADRYRPPLSPDSIEMLERVRAALAKAKVDVP